MKKSPSAVIGCLLLSCLLLLSGCQKSDQPASPPTATPAPAPPPPPLPPPPPETSLGTLVKVERAGQTMVEMATLNTRFRGGIAYEAQQQKAGKGKTFVVLHFEGKPKLGGAKIWLTDEAGKKYSEGMWYAPKKVKDQKEKAQVSYEVPSDATGLVWHDGKQPYKLEPVVVALQPEAEKAPSGGKQ